MQWLSNVQLLLAVFALILVQTTKASSSYEPEKEPFDKVLELSKIEEQVKELKSQPKDETTNSSESNADRYVHLPDYSVRDYVITEQRLRAIRSNFMYWYFDKGGDNNLGDYQSDVHSSRPQIHINLNFQLPFFGSTYDYTRLSINGFLEFSDPPEHYKYPLVFPVKGWPKENDPTFIGIFFSKCRIGKLKSDDLDQRKPGVYFRMERDLNTRTDQFGVELRERVKWDIREAIVGSDNFNPKHAIIVTWKNVSFAGGIDNALYRTNTFQMVLATDDVHTYAMFNYLNLQWTTHTEAGGDTVEGNGGVPAFIGFNAGNGTQSYEYRPYSQMVKIRDLTGTGWVNGFPGRHIFRIDGKIMPGNCIKDIAGANLNLVFAPERGNMLGGTVVNITGPCFDKNDRVRCRFDTEEVSGTVIDANRAICVQPFVRATGYVRLAVAINDGPYNWKGKYLIESPETAMERIFFDTKDVQQRYPSEIKIRWNNYNLISNLNAGVQMSLWGYRGNTIMPELEYIDSIEEMQPNTGVYAIAPANYRNRYNPSTVLDMQFGFINVNLTNPSQYAGLKDSPVLWSRPIPLAWYFAPQWNRICGSLLPQRRCDEWIIIEKRECKCIV